MLYLIGLGLGDPKDISPVALDIIKNSEKLFLEAYTSIFLDGGKETLEAFYGREIILADRDLVEAGSDTILGPAKIADVCLLVVGDPLGATTHTDILLRAESQGIKFKVIHNASIISAIGITGLDCESFGEIVSIPFWSEDWKPVSYYDKIMTNWSCGLHTLCLLDIKVKEQTVENIIKKRKIYEPPRYMRTHQAASQIMETIGMVTIAEPLRPSNTCIACVRVGTDKQKIVIATLEELASMDLGEPLHSLVICSNSITPEELTRINTLHKYFSTETTNPSMGVLRIVGMGISLQDVTIKGRESFRKCRKIFVDARHTPGYIERDLVAVAGQHMHPLRETSYEEILALLKNGHDVGVLQKGDPLILTDQMTQLCKILHEGFKFEVVHNASMMNCVASSGLQLYTFGEMVYIPEPIMRGEKSVIEEFLDSKMSCMDKIIRNKTLGWHSLCILDTRDGVDPSRQFLVSFMDAMTKKEPIKWTLDDRVILVCRYEVGLRFLVRPLSHFPNCEDMKPLAFVIPGITHPIEQSYIDMLRRHF